MYTTPKPTLSALASAPFAAELDEQARLTEQREVNAGMRATFAAVNSTLRSQGAAIRGLEELLKRTLPEIDRLSKADKLKASLGSVEAVLGEVGRLGEWLTTGSPLGSTTRPRARGWQGPRGPSRGTESQRPRGQA